MIDATPTTDSRLQDARDAAVAAELETLNHYVGSLRESLELWDKFVSFDQEELLDDEGREVWSKIGLQDFSTGSVAIAYRTDSELTQIRNQCRWLALHNEFAINGHENRISYIVGQGHRYKVEAASGQETDDALIDLVRAWFEQWQKANKWHKRQQEIVLRRDRDGEAFLRYFPQEGGLMLLRFVEPERVLTPESKAGDKNVRFGIQFDPDDAETALGYFIEGGLVDALNIQHRKLNVDQATPRGLPTFYPVRKNLRRAEKILRNTGTLAEIRATIAAVVKHASGSAAKVQELISGASDVQVTNAKAETTYHKRYRPGTILHHGTAQEYEFPSHQTDVGGFIVALQAELRAVAARLVMPEFMLTSDASNANYASTMVAEGPAVKMFQRLQHDMTEEDREVIDRSLAHAVAEEALPAEVLEAVQITAEPPTVTVRDRQKEAAADSMLHRDRVLSKKTYAARHNLDYDTEQENMEEEDEREDGFAGGGMVPAAFIANQANQTGKETDDGE